MKTSDKLSEAYDKFRPHINGHRTAMNLFFEALREVEEMEQELSKLHQPNVIGRSEQLVSFLRWYVIDESKRDEPNNIRNVVERYLNETNCH